MNDPDMVGPQIAQDLGKGHQPVARIDADDLMPCAGRIGERPEMLNIVRMPSSARTGATCFMAAWCFGANMNPTPASSMALATTSGPTSRLTPSAASTSAEPDLDETDLLPCFATGTPAPAATNAVQVEML